MHLQNTTFFTSSNKINQLPFSVAEVAFAGRSNAGKSTAINCLTNQKGLAKSSKTPGRTQLINFFQVVEQKFLVDLPGYGFAKVPAKIQAHWLVFMAEYLKTRASLKGVVLLMDIRHPLSPLDIDFLELLADLNLSVHIILTKADKLKRAPALNQLRKVQTTIANFKFENIAAIQIFSSEKYTGVDEARAQILSWLNA